MPRVAIWAVILLASASVLSLAGPLAAEDQGCQWSARLLTEECKTHCRSLTGNDLLVCEGVCSRAGVNLAQNKARYEKLLNEKCPSLKQEEACQSVLWLFRADYIPEGPGYSQGHRAVREVWKAEIEALPCLINTSTCRKDCSLVKPW